MPVIIRPNGSTWQNGKLTGHLFEGLNYLQPFGLLNLPADCELRDEGDNRWFLGLFPETERIPHTLLNKSFSNRKCLIFGEKMGRLDGGIGTIRVRRIELVQ